MKHCLMIFMLQEHELIPWNWELSCDKTLCNKCGNEGLAGMLWVGICRDLISWEDYEAFILFFDQFWCNYMLAMEQGSDISISCYLRWNTLAGVSTMQLSICESPVYLRAQIRVPRKGNTLHYGLWYFLPIKTIHILIAFIPIYLLFIPC